MEHLATMVVSKCSYRISGVQFVTIHLVTMRQGLCVVCLVYQRKSNTKFHVKHNYITVYQNWKIYMEEKLFLHFVVNCAQFVYKT